MNARCGHGQDVMPGQSQDRCCGTASMVVVRQRRQRKQRAFADDLQRTYYRTAAYRGNAAENRVDHRGRSTYAEV
jgi:hypothetical protein